MLKEFLSKIRQVATVNPSREVLSTQNGPQEDALSTEEIPQKIPHPMPPQSFQPVISPEDIRAGLASLSPELPWCHYFDFGAAGKSITPDQERYYGKAKGLKIIGLQVRDSIPFVTRRGTVTGLSVLDLTSAEGQHSIELAMAGAGRVVGIEGRKLYVDRSSFVARCFGATNLQFRQGDVRRIVPAELGTFELVLFLGILHHLGPNDFLPMLKLLRSVTSDTLFLYTHTAEAGADLQFGNRLSAPIKTEDGFIGRLYREHPDGLSVKELERRVRSSLDNTFSFWAKEGELVRGLKDAGFSHVSRQLYPNPFGDPAGDFRVMFVCRA